MKSCSIRAELFLGFLAALSNLAQAQITIGYTNWSGSPSALSVATMSGTTQATGSTFVAAVINAPSATSVPTVTDNMGNNAKWTNAKYIATYPGQARTLAVYYCINCAGGSGHVVTATWSGTASGSIGLVEFKGLSTSSTLDSAPSGVNNTTGSPIAAPSITTSSANELVVNVLGTYGSNSQTLTDSGSPWSIAISQQSSNTYQNGAIAWQLVATSGSTVHDSFTYSTFDYTAALSISLTQTAPSCTHNFWKSTGAFAQPDGSTGSYWSSTGIFATPNCSSGNYWRQDGSFSAN